jgi:hypothetical protein
MYYYCHTWNEFAMDTREKKEGTETEASGWGCQGIAVTIACLSLYVDFVLSRNVQEKSQMI